MRDSSWFRRLEVALGFDAGFEIFLLIGRGELARPALARVAEELGRAGAVKWHRLHLDGLDGLLADEQPEGLLHLVHGFERMPRNAAIDMAARLNVNRDRLEVLRGPVIFWIPADFYEELLRQAPDFVAWRSQASVVVEDDLELSDEVVAEQFVVCRTLVAAAPALARVPGFDVMVQGVRRPVLEWLREGTERSLRCSAQDGAPELLAWCAGMLARLHDADEREFVPLLLPASLLDLAQHVGADDGLFEGLRKSWGAGRLQIIVAVRVSMEERESLISQVGRNSVVLAVADGALAEIAALNDSQIRAVIELSLAELEADERARWRPVMLEVLGALEVRMDRFAGLAGLSSYWRALGWAVVSKQSQFRGWREHCIRVAANTRDKPLDTRVRPAVDLSAVLAHDVAAFARIMLAFGGLGHDDLLRGSIHLFRAEHRSIPRPEFIEALLASAEHIDDAQLELSTCVEAVSWARVLEREHPTLLLRALARLGFAQFSCRDYDAAESTIHEGIALAQRLDMGTASLCAQLVRCLLARDEFARALTMAEQGLQALDRDAENFGARMMLLDACAEACSKLGMDERALEYETQKFELRLEHSEQKWPVLAILADKLFRANALDRALDVANQAIESQREQEDDLPLLGETGALHLLADIQRARGDRQATIAALREAIRVYRAVIEYQGPGWSQRFLALTLLDLAAELDSDAALVHLREAVELLEQVDHTPGQYPAALADALVQLGDHAAARHMHELAATAYARVLALASPFPARESEALADVERHLREVCGTGGIAVDDALTRGQQPLAWSS